MKTKQVVVLVFFFIAISATNATTLAQKRAEESNKEFLATCDRVKSLVKPRNGKVFEMSELTSSVDITCFLIDPDASVPEGLTEEQYREWETTTRKNTAELKAELKKISQSK